MELHRADVVSTTSSTRIPAARQITGGKTDDEDLSSKKPEPQPGEPVKEACAWNNRRDIFFEAEDTREEGRGEESVCKLSLCCPLFK